MFPQSKICFCFKNLFREYEKVISLQEIRPLFSARIRWKRKGAYFNEKQILLFFWQSNVSNCCQTRRWAYNLTFQKLNRKFYLLIENSSLLAFLFQSITRPILLGNMNCAFLIFFVFPAAFSGKPFRVKFLNVLFKAYKKKSKSRAQKIKI